MQLKGKKATQESEKETPTQTLKDIEFPEIPRRLLLCLRNDFIIYYFPLLELESFSCRGCWQKYSSCAATLPPIDYKKK